MKECCPPEDPHHLSPPCQHCLWAQTQFTAQFLWSFLTGITESLSNFLYLRVPLLQLLTNLLPELVLLLHRDGIPVVRHQDELQGLLVPIQRALSKNLATSWSYQEWSSYLWAWTIVGDDSIARKLPNINFFSMPIRTQSRVHNIYLE